MCFAFKSCSPRSAPCGAGDRGVIAAMDCPKRQIATGEVQAAEQASVVVARASDAAAAILPRVGGSRSAGLPLGGRRACAGCWRGLLGRDYRQARKQGVACSSKVNAVTLPHKSRRNFGSS